MINTIHALSMEANKEWLDECISVQIHNDFALALHTQRVPSEKTVAEYIREFERLINARKEIDASCKAAATAYVCKH